MFWSKRQRKNQRSPVAVDLRWSSDRLDVDASHRRMAAVLSRNSAQTECRVFHQDTLRLGDREALARVVACNNVLQISIRIRQNRSTTETDSIGFNVVNPKMDKRVVTAVRSSIPNVAASTTTLSRPIDRTPPLNLEPGDREMIRVYEVERVTVIE